MPNRCTVRVLEFTQELNEDKIDAMRRKHNIMIQYDSNQGAGWPIYDVTGNKQQLINFLTSPDCGMELEEILKVYPELK